MGYRSEVSLALLEEDYNKLLELAKPMLDMYGKNAILSDEPKRFERNGEKIVYLHWDALKWYRVFDEVALIENFIREHRHCFLRIGEDYDDIEYDVEDGIRDTFWSILYLKREICLWECVNE